jgi:hypothetical protein
MVAVSPVSDGLFADLSSRLADAHRRVRELDVDNDEKARATRRLLSITEASKRDLQRASKRLDAFLADLASGRVAATGTPDEGSGA